MGADRPTNTIAGQLVAVVVGGAAVQLPQGHLGVRQQSDPAGSDQQRQGGGQAAGGREGVPGQQPRDPTSALIPYTGPLVFSIKTCPLTPFDEVLLTIFRLTLPDVNGCTLR